MKVFLGWSGGRSKAVAAALRKWLPQVLQGVEPFMSDNDLEAGVSWLAELDRELVASDVGVLCLTPENLRSPWMLFEAGFLKSAATTERVVPYLFGLKPADVAPPLGTLQCVEADKTGTSSLVATLARHHEITVPADVVNASMAKWWNDLDQELSKIEVLEEEGAAPPKRTTEDMLEEIIEAVRRPQLRPAETSAGPLSNLLRKLVEHRRTRYSIVWQKTDQGKPSLKFVKDALGQLDFEPVHAFENDRSGHLVVKGEGPLTDAAITAMGATSAAVYELPHYGETA